MTSSSFFANYSGLRRYVSIFISCPTFLNSLEGVVAIDEFDRDGDLLRLQDLVVQVEICHRQTKHLVIFPR